MAETWRQRTLLEVQNLGELIKFEDVPVYFNVWPPACVAVAHGLCCKDHLVWDGAGFHFVWYKGAIWLWP